MKKLGIAVVIIIGVVALLLVFKNVSEVNAIKNSM